MKFKSLPWEDQPGELLVYLGVRAENRGYAMIDRCIREIRNGMTPGPELYDRVAFHFRCTRGELVLRSEQALLRSWKRRRDRWEEIFLGLKMSDMGLTLFLRRAAAWLCCGEIAYYFQGHVKYRLPVHKGQKETDDCSPCLSSEMRKIFYLRAESMGAASGKMAAKTSAEE